MSIIEVKNLSCQRGAKNILKDINWRVNEQEHTLILGLNGSGKTTLLAAVSGYVGYTSGEVKLWNTLLTEENVLEQRRQVSFVSKSYFDRCYRKENTLNIVLSGLYGQLSERFGLTSADVVRAKRLLRGFGLRRKMDYPYDLLSQGQQQSVLICRALMVKPKLLLLDEPYSGLDLIARQFFLNMVEQIGEESKATIICVTHYMEEILPLFSHVVLLKKGMIYSQGRAKDVLTNNNLSGFFGENTTVYWQDGRFRLKIAAKHTAERIWQ